MISLLNDSAARLTTALFYDQFESVLAVPQTSIVRICFQTNYKQPRKQRDRKTDGWKDRQTNKKQTDGQTDTEKRTNSQTENGKTDRQFYSPCKRYKEY